MAFMKIADMILHRWHVSGDSYRKWYISSVCGLWEPSCKTCLNTMNFHQLYLWLMLSTLFHSTTPPKSKISLYSLFIRGLTGSSTSLWSNWPQTEVTSLCGMIYSTCLCMWITFWRTKHTFLHVGFQCGHKREKYS